MMTPLELEKLEFDKCFGGGYSRQNVDDAMEMIRTDYEAIYKENIAYKDKISVLEELVSKYKEMEDTMKNSIILAQQSGESAISAAREQADSILNDAKLRSEAMIREAEREQKEIRQEAGTVKKDLSVFAAKNISLLQSQIEILNQMTGK